MTFTYNILLQKKANSETVCKYLQSKAFTALM